MMALCALIDPGRDARSLNGQRPSKPKETASERQPESLVRYFPQGLW
jgi:hypothetical protein